MRTIKFRRKKRGRMPALNTTSTADISFILLIFFLVTTSLDTDKGLQRQLPPMPKEENHETMEVDREKVIEIDIDANDKISVNGKETTAAALPKQIEKFITAFPTEHIVSVHADRESSYDVYFKIQNTIINVYQSLRDSYRRKQFGKPYAKANQENKEAAIKAFPQRISEQLDTAEETTRKGGDE